MAPTIAFECRRRKREPSLDCGDLPYLGDLAFDQALYGVGEVELRERAPLAGPNHLDADRAALLVARDDPGVPPVGPHRRTDLVQRLLYPALHVALLGHLLRPIIRPSGTVCAGGTVVE